MSPPPDTKRPTVLSPARRVAVLGSNSFSGSDFIDLLLEDPEVQVLGISRSPEKGPLFLPYLRRHADAFAFHQGDLNHDLDAILDVLDEFAPTHLVNFAAQSEVAPSWEHPEHWYETNVVALARFTSQLLRRSYLQRYLHISSPEVYGSCDHDVREDEPPHPSTPYAVSKAAADFHLATLVQQFGFPCVTVRATNVYGAHQQLWKIIPRSVIRIRSGQRIPLHGGGSAVKSYIHIRDVSRGELAVLESGELGSLYHISPDGGVAVRAVVETIAELMGVAPEDAIEVVAERPGQDAAYLVDSGRIRRELRWAPQVGLEEGLRGVIDWVTENWDAILREEHDYIHIP
jgi:dTDP-glucose 4,6-dehydratase